MKPASPTLARDLSSATTKGGMMTGSFGLGGLADDQDRGVCDDRLG